MDGRAFLDVAAELARGGTEAHRRTAAGRACYALFLEARDLLDRWSMPCPPRDNVHSFVTNTLVYSKNPNIKGIGLALERLLLFRNEADYQLSDPNRHFSHAGPVLVRIKHAREALALLDAIDGDAARRAAAIASIRPK